MMPAPRCPRPAGWGGAPHPRARGPRPWPAHTLASWPLMAQRQPRRFRRGLLSEPQPGPESVSELYAWPRDVATALFSNENNDKFRNFKHMLELGVANVTDYSGIDMPRESMRCLLKGLQSLMNHDIDMTKITWQRSCDSGKLQRKCLEWQSRKFDGGSSCVFKDLLHRLPEHAQQWIQSHWPSKTSSKEDRIAAIQDIQHWLMDHRAELFKPDMCSYCTVHEKFCPVVPEWTDLLPQGHFDLGGFDDDGADEPQVKRRRLLMDSARQEALNLNRPTFVHTAGVTCTGWSPAGNQDRYADDSEVYHAAYLAERQERAKQCLEDVAFVECSSLYPAAVKLQQQLPDHVVLFIHTGPEQQGWPIRRRRMLAVCINKYTMAWTGPSQQNIQADYNKHFARTPQMHGSVLLLATADQRFHEYHKLALAHGYILDEKTWEDMDFEEEVLPMLVAPGILRIHSEHAALRDQFQSLGGSYMCDLYQHPRHRQGGPHFPCLVKHGVIYNFSNNRRFQCIATGLEHFGALGFHLFPETTTQFEMTPLAGFFHKLRRNQMIQLAGNGMHLQTQAAWMGYVLSQLVRKDCRLSRAVQEASDPEED